MVSFTRVAVVAIAAAAMGVEASKVGNAIKGVVSSVVKRRGQNSIWERDESLNELMQEYPQCMSALKTGPHPHVKVGADQSLTITGMPEICITQIEAHNAKPEAEKAKEQGTATVNKDKTVTLKGVAPNVVSFFEKLN